MQKINSIILYSHSPNALEAQINHVIKNHNIPISLLKLLKYATTTTYKNVYNTATMCTELINYPLYSCLIFFAENANKTENKNKKE